MSATAFREVRSVLIPVQPLPALLPNAAVAEVIAYRQAESWEGAPDWFLGLLDWRHRLIPVVSVALDKGAGGASQTADARIVVCNTLNGSKKLPFIGILAYEIPHLVRATSDNTETITLDFDSELIAGFARIADTESFVLDLDRLEEQVSQVMSAG